VQLTPPKTASKAHWYSGTAPCKTPDGVTLWLAHTECKATGWYAVAKARTAPERDADHPRNFFALPENGTREKVRGVLRLRRLLGAKCALQEHCSACNEKKILPRRRCGSPGKDARLSAY
jgi:hypothetical protein